MNGVQCRTYIDTSVLIAAIRGKPEQSKKALEILDSPERQVFISDAVRLEILPKPIYEKHLDEQSTLEELFESSETLPWKLEILREAYDLACHYGIAAMDSIHLAFAVNAQVDEFITAERSEKPLFRFNQRGTKPQIRSLRDV